MQCIMHQCLCIVEVQRSIFNQVYWKSEGRATLARLARACRAFNNTALDILWAELDSFVYLVRCLPRDLWQMEIVDKRLSLQRPMSLRDWEIFMKYASRIRALGHSFMSEYLAQFMNLGDDIIFALSNPPTHGPLIPYLKTLHWYHPDKRHASLLRLLLTPCLVSLSLNSFALCIPEISVMTCIGTVCPGLKSLRIASDGSFGSVRDAKCAKVLSEALLDLHTLESLACPALDEAAIVHLSRLPHLVNLSLELQPNFQSEKVRPFMKPPVFASVQSLTIRAHALSALTLLLEPMQFKPCNVSFVVTSKPTPDALRLFFIALFTACDPEKLTCFSLTTSNRRQRGATTQQITLTTFEPLLAFPNIQSFEFDAPCDIAFDDRAIATLSKHWPELGRFSLNASCGWGIASRVTHRGLITLLSRCHSLYEFALSVDFTEIDGFNVEIPHERIGKGVKNEGCVTADFVTSSIRFPIKIAAFLSDVCPEVQEVVSSWSEAVLVGTQVSLEEMQSFQEKWEEVDTLLPAFSAVRKQCMDWAVKEAREESITSA